MLDRYLVDEVAIEAIVSDANVDGIPTYGARVVVPARIEDVQKTIRYSDGTQITTSTQIALRTFLGPRDRVWIPPATSNTGPRVFAAGHTFVDADARCAVRIMNARRRSGRDGHCEAGFA